MSKTERERERDQLTTTDYATSKNKDVQCRMSQMEMFEEGECLRMKLTQWIKWDRHIIN